MKVKISLKTTLTSSFFLLILILSVLFYLFSEKKWNRRVFLFPNIGSSALSGEDRYLPKRETLKSNLLLFINELILGPKKLNHLNLLPRSTTIKNVILQDRLIYLNFSEDLVLYDEEVPFSVEEILQAVANNVLYNFPFFKKVFIFINGQLPLSDSFAQGIIFSKKLIK